METVGGNGVEGWEKNEREGNRGMEKKGRSRLCPLQEFLRLPADRLSGLCMISVHQASVWNNKTVTSKSH